MVALLDPPDNPLREEKAFLAGTAYLRLHNFPQAILQLERVDSPEALYSLGWAYLMSHSFQKAEECFQKLTEHPALKQKALLALAHCFISQGQSQKAEKLLELSSESEQSEILLLKGRIAPTFAEREKIYRTLTERSAENGEYWYERGLNAFRESHFSLAGEALLKAFERLQGSDKRRASNALYLSAQILFHQGKLDEAEQKFLKVTQDYPESPMIAECLLFAAKCREGEKGQEYRRKVFEQYPTASCAAEAYFTYYPYHTYVQGERAAIKHLQAMSSRFPESPYLIIVYYLIGMDEKRDRKTAQGKWIRKKNEIAAIDSFQEAETLFDKLDASHRIPEEERPFFLQARYRATLERALANLNIAETSQGAKRLIFLQYATDLFDQMSRNLEDSALLEECRYWLAQTYLKAGEDDAAEALLKEMSQRYASTPMGYYPSRTWYELAALAMRKKDFRQALQFFTESEKAAGVDQKKLLSSADQKIDLWIQQSLCYREMQDYTRAMLLLSQAINDMTISSQRVKAMYLRAEIYALQGRHDLERKQLEATAKKGGEWALKAKQRIKGHS
jgi:TolA-binding protein